MSNQAAVALARKRWDNVSEDERFRIGRELTAIRMRKRRSRARARKAPKQS